MGFPKCATTFILARFEEYSFETLTDGEFPIEQLEDYREEIKRLHEQGKKVAIKKPTIIFDREFVDSLQRSGCKIIVSVRNPVRWLKSFYNFRLRMIEQGAQSLPEGFSKIPSFGEIIDNKLFFMGVAIKRGMMSKFINKNLLNSRFFDSDRTLFVIQEEFECRHDAVQRELLDFLEIPNSSRSARNYQFEYNSSDRWSHFNDDRYDRKLYEIYASEISALCSLIKEQTGKDLKGIWEEFYSIRLDQSS